MKVLNESFAKANLKNVAVNNFALKMRYSLNTRRFVKLLN